jgi:short-subunit dehydrogenase involved in D-alanine esterification of teichoic acids
MAFPYKKVLLVGATSGIGRALAASLVEHGCFVIAVGRRQDLLDSFVQEHGADKAASFNLDISKLDTIPDFVKSVTSSHPDLDCVFVNSGIQRRSVFSEPESIDINQIQDEMTVNYVSYVALAKEFLPFLMAKGDTPTSLIFTSSNLALVPILRCSNYCASKAALHHWILCLREQLKTTNVKVIEVFPPIVQTELHDPKHQPDMAETVRGKPFGIPVEEFTKETMAKLLAGEDQIAVGLSNIAFNSWEQQRQQAFRGVVEMMRKGGF